jgi:chaperonin GroES
VITLGTGGKDEDGNDFKFSVKKKDTVLISKYGGTDVKLNGKDVLIINESDILAIVS